MKTLFVLNNQSIDGQLIKNYIKFVESLADIHEVGFVNFEYINLSIIPNIETFEKIVCIEQYPTLSFVLTHPQIQFITFAKTVEPGFTNYSNHTTIIGYNNSFKIATDFFYYCYSSPFTQNYITQNIKIKELFMEWEYFDYLQSPQTNQSLIFYYLLVANNNINFASSSSISKYFELLIQFIENKATDMVKNNMLINNYLLNDGLVGKKLKIQINSESDIILYDYYINNILQTNYVDIFNQEFNIIEYYIINDNNFVKVFSKPVTMKISPVKLLTLTKNMEHLTIANFNKVTQIIMETYNQQLPSINFSTHNGLLCFQTSISSFFLI